MGLITYENLEDGQKVTANVFNERFAQIVAQLNGNLDESNFANEGISKEKLQAEVYESMYPIGSQYVNFTDSTNPATLLGFGVWQAVEGRVVVGYDATQSEFNAAEKTGGAKTQALTNAQMPVHSLTISHHGDEGGSTIRTFMGTGATTSGTWHSNTYRNSSGSTSGAGSYQNATVTWGADEAHNNLQPYITAYVWKRIS